MSMTRIALVILCLVFLVVILAMVKKKQLTMRYSLLWICLSITMLICALFPQIVYLFSNFVGFMTPSNFLFFVAIFFLLAISLSLSVIVSRQQRRITTLIQQLAIERYARHQNDEDDRESAHQTAQTGEQDPSQEGERQ